MAAPEDIRFGALSHERECPDCGHSAHWTHCGADLLEGVLCPCHCPVPGIS